MIDRSADALYMLLWLVLPISALAARRIPMKDTLKMALAWVAIFGIAFILVAAWQRAVGTGAAVGGLFG